MRPNLPASPETALEKPKTRLSSGCYGDTMLVLSLEDNQIYVRKVEHVRRFKPQRLFQSDDVEHVVYHPYIPNLETWRDHITENGATGQSTADRFVLSTSTWFFCNGGTVADLYDDLENAYDYDRIFKVPEACLWKFLRCIVDVLTHVHQSGIAHSDTHENNWFLHWSSPDSVLPEVHLGDFGLATRFPAINHQDFHLPLQGDFNWRNQTCSLNISKHDLKQLTEWYTLVRQDWRDGLNLVRTLLFISDPNPLQFLGQQQASRCQQIDLAAETGMGLMGYSAELVAVLSKIQKTIEKYWNHPAALGNFFTSIHEPLNQLAIDAVGRYLAGPATNSMLSFKRPLPTRSPITFKDPQPLLDFTNIGATKSPPLDVRLQLQLHTGPSPDMNGLFAQYRDGDDLISDPVMKISHPVLGETIRLRRREYRVACILHETTDPSRFQILNFVDSLDDCTPLSPDAERIPIVPKTEDESESQETYIKREEFDRDNHPLNSLHEIPQPTRTFNTHYVFRPVPQQPVVVDWPGDSALHVKIPAVSCQPLQVRTQQLRDNLVVVLEFGCSENG